jgi:O-antigen/teichoic acid export membrane protein
MRRASAQVGLAKLCSSGLAVVLNVALARELAVAEYGVYSQWLAYLNILGLILTFGLNASHIYHYQLGLDLFRRIALVYSMAALALIGAALLFNSFYSYVVGGALAVSAVSMVNADAQARNAHGMYALQVIGQSVLLLAAVGASLYFYDLRAGVSVLAAYALAQTAFFLIVLLANARVKRRYPSGKFSISYLIYGARSFALNLMGQLLYTGDIFIIAYLLPKEDVAIYSVASLIAKGLWLVMDAVGLVLFPSLVKLEPEDRVKKVLEAIKLSALICLLPALIFFVLGERLLVLFFGSAYADSLMSAHLLIAASFPLIIYKLGSRLAAATQHWRFVYVLLFSAILVNVVLNFILIPHSGIERAAFASFVAYTLTGVVLLFNLKVISKNVK